MRIIAGIYKGRSIDAVRGSTTRPTTDRVREAWASTIASLLPDGFAQARVLDAFAGSGACGLEALSRGASSCLFCDRDARAYHQLQDNLRQIGVADGAAALRLDVLTSRAAAVLAARGPFDLLVFDPPYDTAVAAVMQLLQSLAARGAVADQAVVSYERRSGGSGRGQAGVFTDMALQPGFEVVTCKNYGNTSIDYLRYTAASGEDR